jgi:hypothetical protein
MRRLGRRSMGGPMVLLAVAKGYSGVTNPLLQRPALIRVGGLLMNSGRTT